MRFSLPFLAVITLVATVGVRADELKLKDGTKIVGTIVGFEDSSFKVKTSYGFAVVQRDQVLSISVSDAAKKDPDKKAESDKKADSEKKPGAVADKPAAPVNTASGATNSAAATDPLVLAGAQPRRAESKPAANIASASPAKPNPPATASSAPIPSAAQSAPTPAPPAAPEPIREQVTGNTYVNETYGFRMYKPPDWQLIAGARSLLPGAITAMGTDDQTTYLLIGQDAAGKSIASDMDATETRLRGVLENFRPLGEKHIAISGSDAIERRFRGSVDQHDWSGVVVVVPRGKQVYTIFGMTYADTDLVQIQENVISRAISSLQFTK